MLITFSGLDGSGKSTLIKKMVEYFENEGTKVAVLTMYDHVSVYALIRLLRDRIKQLLGIKGKKRSEDPIEFHPDKPINPRDPKIDVSDKQSGIEKIVYLFFRSLITRRIMLFADLLSLQVFRFYYEVMKKHVVITDRYLYDTLADVSDLQSKRWIFVRTYLLISPTPNIPIFVDIDPEIAYMRKKEYPIEYMKWRRATYHKIFGWVKEPLIIYNSNLEESEKILKEAVKKNGS